MVGGKRPREDVDFVQQRVLRTHRGTPKFHFSNSCCAALLLNRFLCVQLMPIKAWAKKQARSPIWRQLRYLCAEFEMRLDCSCACGDTKVASCVARQSSRICWKKPLHLESAPLVIVSTRVSFFLWTTINLGFFSDTGLNLMLPWWDFQIKPASSFLAYPTE